MARISLLFTLALVLAISSVSAHPPSIKKTKKTLCPPTLSGLQTFPSVEISKLIEKKVKSAPNTAQFNTLFAICKAYSNQLAAFKVAGVKNVFGGIHAKYAMMTKAMFAAQALVGVEGDLEFKLGKSYTAMAAGFVELEEKIAEISAKYEFNANAKISKGDKAKIEKCLIKLKGSINVFVKVISQCSKKFSAEKQMGIPAAPGGGFINGFVKKGVEFGGNLIGLGAHGQAKAEAGVEGHAGAEFGAKAGAKVGGHAGFGAKAGAKVGGHAGAGAGAGFEAKAGAKIGGQAGAKAGGKAGAKVGGHAGGKIGAQGEAKVGGHGGGLFGGFLGFRGNVQYDAAGKAKIGGGSGFRPLSHPRNKHLD